MCQLDPGNWSSATIKRSDAGEIADREVDLAEQQHVDDAVGEHRRAGRLGDQVDEVDRGEEVRRRQPEDEDDDDLADDDRERAEVARAQVEPPALIEPGEAALGAAPPPAAAERGPARRHRQSSRRRLRRRRDARHLRRRAGGDRLDDRLLRRRAPVEQADVPAEPNTVIRSAVSNTSWRLCEMRITARPCSPSRRTSASTCSVCATPRAAVGSSRMTSFEFHWTAFATATDCRWPPESVATGWRTDRIVVTASDFSVADVVCSIAASFKIWNRLTSRPR